MLDLLGWVMRGAGAEVESVGVRERPGDRVCVDTVNSSVIATHPELHKTHLHSVPSENMQSLTRNDKENKE